MGRHTARTDLGKQFGATHVVAARGDEGIAEVMQIGGEGSHVGLGPWATCRLRAGIRRRPARRHDQPGRVPHCEDAPVGSTSLFGKNATLTGGPATVRAHLETVLPLIPDSTIDPGRVFDRELALADIAEGYRLMDQRQTLEVLIRP